MSAQKCVGRTERRHKSLLAGQHVGTKVWAGQHVGTKVCAGQNVGTKMWAGQNVGTTASAKKSVGLKLSAHQGVATTGTSQITSLPTVEGGVADRLRIATRASDSC
jgi:hypothetical protein